ncbi:MAG: deoxyribose-phosphate aldolase [Methanobacteriaceae archaeon]|jgi:deoxyribose-phosphate aldolase|nr:deoxyribose-phosphate aldolase [Methanobacteriaceae archaeon]
MYKFKKANDLAKYLDYTNLNNTQSKDEFLEFLNQVNEYKFRSAVISPSFIKLAKEKIKNQDTKITTVIGFPLGFETTEMKIANTKITLKEGADEVDLMINISDVKSRNFEAIENEIVKIKEILDDKVLKVIIETKVLEDNEKIKLSEIIESTDADYIKTSSGFNGINTFFETIHDINLIQKYAPKTKIKASGGITKYKEAYRVISSGADIVGSSSSYEIVKSFEALMENEDVTKEPLKV